MKSNLLDLRVVTTGTVIELVPPSSVGIRWFAISIVRDGGLYYQLIVTA